MAALEACQSAVFVATPEVDAFQITYKHVQDWFAAFLLAALPVTALRSALTGSDGAVVAHLHDAARLARDITDRDDVRAEIDRLFGGVALPSDAMHPSLAGVCHRLDQLEELARNAPWGLWIADRRDELSRLATDGLGGELVGRLLDPKRAQQVKRLLLEVADATNTIEVADAAVKLALQDSPDDELRFDAAWFAAQCGGEAHLRQLEALTHDGQYVSEIAARLAGIVVDELLTRQLSPVWLAALCAPPEDPHTVDNRAAALVKIEQSMTIIDARCLLPHWRKLYQRHIGSSTSHRSSGFLQRVIDLICEQDPPVQADIDALVEVALEFASDSDEASLVVNDIASRTKDNTRARLRFYQHDIEALLNGQSNRIPFARWLLRAEDWRWLWDQAAGPWDACRQVWDDAYRLARVARAEGHLSDGEWDALLVARGSAFQCGMGLVQPNEHAIDARRMGGIHCERRV